jgi:hypothetical protein
MMLNMCTKQSHIQKRVMLLISRALVLLGVHSSLDGTSEQSVKDWNELFGNIAEIYNQSPLSKHTGHLIWVIDIFVKLCGMHTDHCSKEKKTAHLLEKENMTATYQSLGEDNILQKSNEENLPYFLQVREQMIKTAGGNVSWNNCLRLSRQNMKQR